MLHLSHTELWQEWRKFRIIFCCRNWIVTESIYISEQSINVDFCQIYEYLHTLQIYCGSTSFKSLQCYEIAKWCSPFPLMLSSLLLTLYCALWICTDIEMTTYFKVYSLSGYENWLSGWLIYNVKYTKRFCIFPETHSFSLDNILTHMCLINDEEVGVVTTVETVDCCSDCEKILGSYKLTKYSLRTGAEVDITRLKSGPNGLVPISLAGRPCVALSYHTCNEIFP